MAKSLNSILNNFCRITDKPNDFIRDSEEIKYLLKCSYDYTKEQSIKYQMCKALPELITEHFDLEQIWQQLELQNEEFLNGSLISISKYAIDKNKLVFEEIQQKNLSNVESDTEEEQDENVAENYKLECLEDDTSKGEEEVEFSDEDSIGDENMKSKMPSQNGKHTKYKKSICDDDFFKLNEMEEFLNNAENDKKSTKKDADEDVSDKEIDLFKEDKEEDDNDVINPKFKDFFRLKDNDESSASQNTRDDVTDEDHSDEENAEDFEINQEDLDAIDNETIVTNKDNQTSIDFKSTFQIREERLKDKIEKFEKRALAEKPWPLRGEILAKNRPPNSLLEHVVEFDLVSRPAPVITENTTLQLEDIIKQRIKDRVFDSVQRKERPVDTPLDFKKKLVLDQEKSKESLAQIYAKEYEEQQQASNKHNEEVTEEKEPELHKEVKKMMSCLFRNLDGLSNFHFTPKSAAPELKIVSNLPAISMEEVAPVATTDAALLAPEEIKTRIKGNIIGKSERTDEDKNRERRRKKQKQQLHAMHKQKKDGLTNKVNPTLNNKYNKEKAKKELEKILKDKNVDKMDESSGSKSLKSSTAFFNQLEDEVRSQVKKKVETKRKLPQNSALNAKKIKM